mmetsp:Transcript_32409/g.53597  ORF Transcript_32409/g.53597 Transcript_32409/m.53597 type:complete len:469 (+) Transcript_32409:136-1542(+)|eukprot:CAMPEP_0119003372 /NCGR_PEP_ID=MMETSP1176-20130426/522_1 /TAXON_ID=265551 /ORGANISM="Synedropsis recta cf, Strain CCMP1620" /LENGTH=468 /DNA_ID=CAMNT_0006954971 /DNA_START=99 /DNA_END=1505 /DNA_ORIENTATION=+
MMFRRVSIAALLTGVAAQNAEYGVDVSSPMHHEKISTNYAESPWNIDPANHKTPAEFEGMAVQPLGNRQKVYDDMIQGCIDYYGDKGFRCKEYESDRVLMTLRQPQSMENYTETGFKKIKAPEKMWRLIKDFWDENDKLEDQSNENWPGGNTYTNHWTSPTRMVNVENSQLRGGGKQLKQAIWDAAQSTIAEWTDQTLHQVSLYGIRIYTRGSILSSHVDRMPLVSSAIINVASDVEEPWPLEVIGHDGRAVNVTMEPGDMVLYESHSVIHGRPFPLKGEFVANLFVHFEPEGHSKRHTGKHGDRSDPDQQYKEDAANGIGGHEVKKTGLPPYLIPGSPEVANYIDRNPNSEAAKIHNANHSTTGTTMAHMYAAAGEVDKLAAVLERKGDLLTAEDENGWTPLHEGARSGNIEVIRYLLSKGANINHVAEKKEGGHSVLSVAHKIHGPDHPISKFIQSVGGELFEPEL